MAAPCYNGPNPIKDDERIVIWKWARDNHIDQGVPLGEVKDAINQHFFNGMAKDKWLNDIITGRKTPFRNVTNEMWRKQYNRQSVIQEAQNLSRWNNVPTWMRVLGKAFNAPRSLAVFGHGIVFPITHAGDLAFRPSSWGTFIKGLGRTYRGAGSSAYAAKVMDNLGKRELYDLAIRSKVDVGPKSHAMGLISNEGGKTGFLKAAARSWDMLTVLRYELWESQVKKHIKPGMSTEEALDIGKNFADWANHATGAGKGPVATLGGNALFGPALTQAKLNRISIDPAKTVKTFLNWNNATAGEKAVAWTRLSGATQFLATNLGFLAANAGVLSALGSKEKVNFTDPTKSDFLAMKGSGLEGYVPGLHTEIRTLGKVLATSFASKKDLQGQGKFQATAKIAGQYGMGKLTPTIQRILEGTLGEDWRGRPLPWSKEPGTEKNPRLTYGEYAAAVGPIPLSGPIAYVYDHLKKGGATAKESLSVVKALIIGGFGAPGFHIHESHEGTTKARKPKAGITMID